MGSVIHSNAIVEDGAVVGDDCEIAAFAVIKKGAVLQDGVKVDHHAVVGGNPQDLSFDPSIESGVIIEEGVTIREGVTVHRSTRFGENTVVKQNAFLMANSHVGHDCVVGENAILANAVLLGGFVEVGGYSFLGGGAAFHQFVRVGESAMVSGLSRVALDVPPFVIAHERNLVSGLNLVGLKRRGFSSDVIRDIKQCFRAVYFAENVSLRKNAVAAAAETEEGSVFLKFFEGGRRGFSKPDRRA